MFEEQRLGNDGTEASRPCKPDDAGNQMKEKDDDIAHPGMVSKPEKHLMLAQFSNSPWTHRSAPVDDRSGAGGLLLGEIPRILILCAHCGPIARCPVDVYAASLSRDEICGFFCLLAEFLECKVATAEENCENDASFIIKIKPIMETCRKHRN
jgi:hypothetical protein